MIVAGLSGEEMKLRTGDLVRLRSGGPLMTVQDYSAETFLVVCEWFDGDSYITGQFLEETLEAAGKPHPVSTRSRRSRRRGVTG